jgi:hypothetical protein
VQTGPSQFAADRRYMLKIPKTFILAWLQSAVGLKLTRNFFKEPCKVDRLIAQVFLMAVRSDGTMPLPSHNKEQHCVAWCCKRYQQFGANLDMKMFPKAGSTGSDANVDWGAYGFYKLQPEFAEDPELSSEEAKAFHKYSHIKVDSMEIDVPNSLNITAAWSMEQNWSLEQAALVTKDAHPKLKYFVRNLRETSIFKEFEVFYTKVC